MTHSKLLLAICLLLPAASQAAIQSRAISKIREESVMDALKLPVRERQKALAEMPDAAYDSLLTISNDQNRMMSMRWRALTSAALLRKQKAVPDLLKASKSEEWFMRNAALLGLSEFSAEQALNVGRRLVKDPALVVRSAAVDVLLKHGGQRERELLWSEIDAAYNKRSGRSLWIRGQIAKGLASQPRDGELALFSNLLKEKEEEIQIASVQGLEKLTKVKLGDAGVSRPRLVQMWRNYFNRPASELR
ncbi:MAG: HEAT repeat domain-containing protein [Bdellovibrionaceae bacterium]|nr:HEAT repeat domain-containing protein [Pseudobdellovibrionaceae bacterium]